MTASEIAVRGVLVSFARRDIRQCTDREREIIDALVCAQQQEVGLDAVVERLVIESDWLDPEQYRINAHYRVSTRPRHED